LLKSEANSGSEKSQTNQPGGINMTLHFNRSLALLATLFASLINISAQPRLTSIDVFTTDSSGTYTGPDIWDTQPGNNYNPGHFDIWIQSSGIFLNGPLDVQVQPDISLPVGESTFALNANPGADYALIGISLFFNGASTPAISAFGPMLTTPGAHSFAADGAMNTPGLSSYSLVPGAGTLSFVSGSELVTLTDFFWATPSVYNQDQVGYFSTGADGQWDYVGGITLSVVPVPEPQVPLLVTGLLAGLATIRRKERTR